MTETPLQMEGGSFGLHVIQDEIYIPDKDDEDQSSIKSTMTMTKRKKANRFFSPQNGRVKSPMFLVNKGH